jgi:outer membrane protein assembly factor BamB
VENGSHRVVAAPAMANNRLFFTSSGAVTCIDRQSGKILWSREQALSYADSSPLLVGDVVFAASSDGFVYALEQSNGSVRWKSSFISDPLEDFPGYEFRRARRRGDLARPVSSASDGTTLFQLMMDQSRVVALDCKTGDRRWAYRARGWLLAHPVVTEKYVLLGGEDFYLRCLDRMTGKQVWEFSTGSLIGAAPAVAGNLVYCAPCNGRVICLNVDTGKPYWSHRTELAFGGTRFIYCAPLVTDDAVYVAAADGGVCALDAFSGEVKWQFYVANDSEIGSFNMATDGTRIFLVTRPNKTWRKKYALYAVGD